MIKLIVIGASNPAIIRLVDDINSHNKDEIEILGFLDIFSVHKSSQLSY